MSFIEDSEANVLRLMKKSESLRKESAFEATEQYLKDQNINYKVPSKGILILEIKGEEYYFYPGSNKGRKKGVAKSIQFANIEDFLSNLEYLKVEKGDFDSTCKVLEEKNIEFTVPNSGALLIVINKNSFWYYPKTGKWRVDGYAEVYESDSLVEFLDQASAKKWNKGSLKRNVFKVQKAEKVLISRGLKYEIKDNMISIFQRNKIYNFYPASNHWHVIKPDGSESKKYSCFGIVDLLDRFIFKQY